MDVLTADNNGKGCRERNKVHGPIRMEKEQIQPHRGHGCQLDSWYFPDNREAVEQHQCRHDQNCNNLSLSDFVYLLLNPF